MPSRFSRRNLMLASALAAMGSYSQSAQVARAADQDEHHEDGEPTLNRFATTVKGAEITGLFLTAGGQLFFNVQHPSEENDVHEGYQQGAVGYLKGFNMNALPEDFESVQLPENESQREQVRTARGTYEFLAHGGDELSNGELLGVPTTPDGEPLTDGMNPDFNGFVPADSSSPAHDSEGFLFTNWEDRPGAMSRLHLRRRGNTYEVVDRMNVNFRDVEGTWVNCFGSVSPWNTPLTSEELYFDNTKDWNNPDYKYHGGQENLAAYLGYYPNPYRYGYITEITEPQSDDPTPVKLTPLGRFSHENSIVMPDEKTVYLSDDGTGTVFFKFVADVAGDLTAGTLYAAKATQDRGRNYNRVGFDLEWLELAHGDAEEIESWIAEYDGITMDDYEDGENSYITDAEIEQWAKGNADDDRVAFLESRKAAEAIGATAEFRKMEGVNIKRGAEPGDYLYMAMSALTKTMADEEGEIKLADNEYGAVYRMQLGEDYGVSRMEPVVTGGPNANVCGGCPYDASPDSKNNACQDCAHNPNNEENDGFVTFSNKDQDPNNTIANPDNLVVMDDDRVIIGEDSGLHDNNMIWVYNPGDE